MKKFLKFPDVSQNLHQILNIVKLILSDKNNILVEAAAGFELMNVCPVDS